MPFSRTVLIYLSAVAGLMGHAHVVSALDEATAKQPQTPALSANEQFRDFLPLTAENFTENVFDTPEPWIVLFHKGEMMKSWKSMAASTRGLVWLGMVDQQAELKLLDELDIPRHKVPQAIVYPYGNALTKKRKAEEAVTAMEAKHIATESLPDKTLHMKADDIQDLLQDSYRSNPSRFPAVFLTNELEVPALCKALANRFQQYFNFGVMFSPKPTDYKKLGFTETYIDMPAMFVLVVKHETTSHKEPELNAVFFQSKSHGDFNYPNIVRFLFTINHEYRYTLPGYSMSNDKDTAEMSDVLEIEGKRFDVVTEKKGGPKSPSSKRDEL